MVFDEYGDARMLPLFFNWLANMIKNFVNWIISVKIGGISILTLIIVGLVFFIIFMLLNRK